MICTFTPNLSLTKKTNNKFRKKNKYNKPIKIEPEGKTEEEKKEILLMNRQLSEENLMLKKQIKELKLKNNINNDKEKDKEIYKKTESDIDSYYTRVEELINELND